MRLTLISLILISTAMPVVYSNILLTTNACSGNGLDYISSDYYALWIQAIIMAWKIYENLRTKNHWEYEIPIRD